MIKKNIFILLILVVFSTSIQSQSGFNFLNGNKKVETVNFKLINNLIVIPIVVNGKELSFLLDTGVDKTIFFNLSELDSLKLNNIKKITLQGLGNNEPLEALLSQNNTMSVNNYVGENQDIYVVLKDKFDISGRMGTTIHGIIGQRILKNAIVYINYSSKKIKFYNPKYYKYSKCRKCEVFPLEFYRNKPYIDAKIQLDTIGNKLTDVKLLIDSGGSESIWLFENSKKEIQTPIKHFKDVLGEGISGTIFGNKSRIKNLVLGRFNISEPTVSFLDSTSTLLARRFKERNGTIGGNILKRFKVWIDYGNKRITLKKNGSFKGGFEYNMSGLDVIYNGKVLVREKESKNIIAFNLESKTAADNTVSLVQNYTYKFKSSYRINNVLPGSPAEKAGLLKGDILHKINGVPVHQYNLNQLLNRFQVGHNKKVKMVVQREYQFLKFQFRLVKKI